jgi:hypothetical protein
MYWTWEVYTGIPLIGLSSQAFLHFIIAEDRMSLYVEALRNSDFICPSRWLCTGIGQTAQVGESVMIRTQMGTHSKSENFRSAWDTVYDTTP